MSEHRQHMNIIQTMRMTKYPPILANVSDCSSSLSSSHLIEKNHWDTKPHNYLHFLIASNPEKSSTFLNPVQNLLTQILYDLFNAL